MDYGFCREILTEKFLTKIKEMRTEFEQVKKRLVFKVKDASNTNTIFDTRKYLLYDDVIEILNEALTCYV